MGKQVPAKYWRQNVQTCSRNSSVSSQRDRTSRRIGLHIGAISSNLTRHGWAEGMIRLASYSMSSYFTSIKCLTLFLCCSSNFDNLWGEMVSMPVDVEAQAFEVVYAASKARDPFLRVEGGLRSLFHPPNPCSRLPVSDAISVVVSTPTKNTKDLLHDWSLTSKENGLTNCSETKSSAYLSMSVQPAAKEVLPAPTATPALSVATSLTAPRNAGPDLIFPIVTKLKADAWELALEGAGILDEFSDIPVGLRQGFLCGLEHFSLACTFIPPNHYTSQEDEDFIISKYAEEISLGRLSHGYEPDTLFSLIGHFRTAPLAVIDNGGDKRRVIVNHSFPKNKFRINLDTLHDDPTEKCTIDPSQTSINTVINSKKFQCAWGSFSECYLLVANAPDGTQAAVFDVDAAFRNIPTHPSARPFLAIMIRGLIHLDHVLNFGASPSPGIFGRVADAMVKIYMKRGIEAVIKWVDDFIFLRYPAGRLSDGSYNFTYSAELIWDVADELGWPWAPKKFVDFSQSFNYIGFLWNLSTKVVELPEKKKKKCLDRISTWTYRSAHNQREAETIIGTLNHVCLVVPEGRSRLVSLFKFRGGFKSKQLSEVKHKLSMSTADDLAWWRSRLQEDFVGMKITSPSEPLNNKVFVDASTSWGIRLVLDGKWLAWQFKEGWRAEGREIGWAEMVAVELAIRTLIAGKFKDCHIVVRSDNQGVVGALKAGRSRGTHQNLILREIVKLMQDHDIWLSTTWISTAENPADGPSRGLFPGKDSLYPHPPKVPCHLTSFVHKAVHYHDLRLL